MTPNDLPASCRQIVLSRIVSLCRQDAGSTFAKQIRRSARHVAVKRQLLITAGPIEEAPLLAKRKMSDGMGAVVHFLGVVRREEEGRAILAIEYEAFQRMAEHQFNLLFDQVERRWPVESVRLVHRIGSVKVNEPSLWVEVVAPHRGEAFAACQWLIDEMKRTVPIWKRTAQIL